MIFGHGNDDDGDDDGYFGDDDNDVVVVLMALMMVGSDLLGSLSFLELKRELAGLLQTHVRAQLDLTVTSISVEFEANLQGQNIAVYSLMSRHQPKT